LARHRRVVEATAWTGCYPGTSRARGTCSPLPSLVTRALHYCWRRTVCWLPRLHRRAATPSPQAAHREPNIHWIWCRYTEDFLLHHLPPSPASALAYPYDQVLKRAHHRSQERRYREYRYRPWASCHSAFIHPRG